MPISFRLRRRFDQIIAIGAVLSTVGDWRLKPLPKLVRNLLHQLTPSQEQTWLI
ncbi:hypothetical protein ACE1CI_18175 [Aerosakkonemataceae cyanobacterium BLCC-F50]|uniref:Uncharacterized protein n=1 Tax=Floridaenema flaviceps BLCC-F50 TaxID=3153642 RepID=A0ABV4XT38_9CYAN